MFIVKVALRGYYKHHCRCISAVQSVEIIFRNSHLICSGALQIHILSLPLMVQICFLFKTYRDISISSCMHYLYCVSSLFLSCTNAESCIHL